MIKLAVIGDPIAHSLSPQVHSAALDAIGIPYTYEKVQVKKGELSSFLDYAREQGIDGFNLTMPHKVDILPYLSFIDKEAERYGAVNTVAVRGEKLYGYNTDADGYMASLYMQGWRPEDKNVVILGAGGVVRTLARKMAYEGAKKVTLLNRTVEKAREICQEIAMQENAECQYDVLTPETLRRYMGDCDLLMNGTPLGMEGIAQDFPDFSFLDEMKTSAMVSDLIYRPAKTNLLQRAEKSGLCIQNGLGMLICQGLLADRIYTGMSFDMQKVFTIVEEKLCLSGENVR